LVNRSRLIREAWPEGIAVEEPHEPDYRFTLANERTLLAWVRTALALDVTGLGVIRFAPQLGLPGGREALGIALILLGTVATGASYRRWAKVDQAMRADAPLPRSAVPRFLTLSLTALSAGTVVLLVVQELLDGL
jgi:putative membrane protein